MRGQSKRWELCNPNIIERLESRLLLTAAPGSVTSLTLINAQTDQPISSIALTPGAVIDLGTVGHELNIQANVAGGATRSVRFNFDGDPNYRIENGSLFDIGGDARGGRNFPSWLPTVGEHTLIVTPYSGKNGAGQLGQSYITLFNVIDSSIPAAPLRVNAGGGKYVDQSGAVFSADQGYLGGWEQTDNSPIAGTLDDALYQTRRQGPGFVYSKRMPDDTYAVTLYFEDPYGGGRNANIFDVSTDTTTLLDHYNIAADVGSHTAAEKTFIVPVTNGRMNLYFDADQGYAMVSAISIVPQRVPLTEAPLYVNAGGLSYTDSIGRTFEPGIGFSGGTTSQTPFAVSGTPDASLYSSVRSGSHFTFSQPVANGDYELWLEFAEPSSALPGQRVFNVSANGTTLLDHYDIVADGGAGNAVAKAFDVQISGGSLNLSFDGVVGDAVVSSIVLIPKDVAADALPYAPQSLSPFAALTQDVNQLLLIGQNLWVYANAQTRNRQAAPPNLAALVSFTELDPDNLASPLTGTPIPQGELTWPEKIAWASTLNDYIYLAAGTSLPRLGAMTPVAYDNPDRIAGDINILFDSGFVGTYTRSQAEQILGIPINDPTHAPPPPPVLPQDPKILASQANLAVIGDADYAFANEQVRNGLSFAPDMGTVAETQDVPPSYFLNPRGDSPPPPAGLNTPDQIAAWVNSTTDYIYTGANKRAAAEYDALLLYENPAEMTGGIDIVEADLVPRFRDMRWAIETILTDRAGGRHG